ncbi:MULTISPECIES: cobyric acid synthase [Corynebacterium]|uniref:cobyric acid synthase n=2 Tax=Corynebacteriaceae TaxID=1653 RepID=UPI0008481AF2|nr:MULTISPECIES: cobyric acid synthase [Corynebacterium]MBC6764042.1 cobyric acid synthase [Corynebacterium sp. LK22]MBC6768667.1 cobyric acid synthase [Corynebacterium sp. LK15]MBC6806394.1 cobyric acid synthase [Corynebacterium sp. LK30]MBC6830202.1 cobyric acid synthase [Corynebacterium sp. LK32]KAA9245433.1 cobyric acid synthase [Corynebacterium amycolatum]
MQAPAALIAGCTSDAGKSVLVAGMCRLLARRGVKVAPFKAQNMSNNCAVTLDGGEIGRAQALQALACGLEPDVSFNPVLLKPGSDHTSQVVVKGKADGHVSALTYRSRRKALRGVVAETLEELRGQFDVVLCEGAGSPAEVNLRESDIANMGLAELADLPVVVAGDIDRGGVLAHFVGTHAILSPEDRARITGFIVNKFRGDVSLLTPGLDVVREHTGVPVLGVVSFIPGLWIDAEDSLGTVAGASVGPANAPLGTETLSVAAIRLPRVSNATDIEALACEPGVHVQWTVDPSVVARADLVVLPGTKSTVADLKWLRERGLDDVLENRAARGLPLIGICGGFQMLCTTITDSVESVAGTVNGLGVFDTDIEFAGTKTLVSHPDGSYEVHNGQVVRSSEAPFITEPEEGARRGMVMGTHRHGYLENDQARRELLMEVAVAVGRDGFEVSPNTSFAGERLLQVDLLANAVEKYLAGPALAQATGIEQLG